MLLAHPPYYTYHFGSLGQTLDSARRSEFFQWFHLGETERKTEEPGEWVRFRPSGESFRELCSFDALTGPAGEMVRIELIVQRGFIEGNNGLFAQDLVKSYLMAALPDACRSLLQDFMDEINTPGQNGETIGYLTFRGRHPAWRTQTGWSRLLLANLPLTEGAVLVLQIGPNPKAPNAKMIQGPDENEDEESFLTES